MTSIRQQKPAVEYVTLQVLIRHGESTVILLNF